MNPFEPFVFKKFVGHLRVQLEPGKFVITSLPSLLKLLSGRKHSKKPFAGGKRGGQIDDDTLMAESIHFYCQCKNSEVSDKPYFVLLK
jgi:hypothetical protein